MSSWLTVKERVGGRWQIPLLFVSVVVLAGSFMFGLTADEELPVEEIVKRLDVLVSGGFHKEAVEFGQARLADEGRAEQNVAPIHLWLGRAVHGASVRSGAPTPDDGDQIITHFRQAQVSGERLTASDIEVVGRAFQWRQDHTEAVKYLERAVDGGVKDSLDLRKDILLIRRYKLRNQAGELIELVDSFIEDVGERRLDLRLWAIEQKLSLLEELGRIDQASTLLARNKEFFEGSDLRDRFAYLEGLVLYKTGFVDEAERYLRTLRNRVAVRDDVHAMSGWLLGRAVLNNEGPARPLEALSFFEDVIEGHPDSPYGVASLVGQAEAFGYLERHAEAIESYRLALSELDSVEATGLVTRDVLRASLSVLADMQRTDGHLRAAVDYASMARELADRRDVEVSALMVQQLAGLQAMLADKLEMESSVLEGVDETLADELLVEVRARRIKAADLFLELAQISTPSEARCSQAAWRSAWLLEQAGERSRAGGMYEEFARERPENALVPRALFRLGLIRKSLGEIPEAIETFRDCADRFDQTLEGVRSLIQLALCHMALGPDGLDLAEKTLRRVLDDPAVLTPEAPEFAEALFLLGDVLNRREEFEDAIGVLEEWLDRYQVSRSDDPRRLRVRFLLADSYRLSGLALNRELAEAAFTAEHRHMRAEAMVRLSRARELYRDLITDYQGHTPDALTLIETLYLRHSLLYEADCLYEMLDYRAALKLYEEAAGVYQDTPSALAVYVQIINCHLFLENHSEVRAALARAEILVDRIPDIAFDGSVSPQTREDWKRYFDWLGKSDLF